MSEPTAAAATGEGSAAREATPRGIESSDDFPLIWDDCTNEQLEWLIAHGSYQQSKIASNILEERAQCVCSEINTRHCPIHGYEGERLPRDYENAFKCLQGDVRAARNIIDATLSQLEVKSGLLGKEAAQ